jgi:hypothetical protein
MNRNLDLLLADILNRQPDDADDATLADAEPRWDGYARGRPWSGADARLVWTSPSARAAYLDAREQALAALRTQWRARGFATALTQRAADSADPARVLEAEGVTVRILRSPAFEDWIVSIELAADAAGLLGPGIRLRLSDNGGRLWAEGVPDAAGGFDAFWADASESPMQRLAAHSLTLEFV